jgi:hypothetical protein
MGGACSTYGRQELDTGLCWEDLTERDHLENPCLDGRIILKLIFRKWDVEAWTGLVWLRTGTLAGVCDCGNEPSFSTYVGKYLE